MNDRTSKEPPRDVRPSETPEPTRPDLMAWIEDKFDGKEGPRYFYLKLAWGPGLKNYDDATIHEKEFKVNKKVERTEMVEVANKFVSVAQEHCNQCEKPQGFIILAVNHVKSAAPYGVYVMKLRPNRFVKSEFDGGIGGDDDDVLSDRQHRDGLLRNSLDHMKENNEHSRFIHDGMMKGWGGVMGLQQEIIKDLREENRLHRAQMIEYYKATEEALSKKQERDMAAATHEMKMAAINHGVQFLMQMVPVVTKAIEGRKQTAAGLLGAGSDSDGPVTESSESMAVKKFIEALSLEQRVELLGRFDPDKKAFVGGILSEAQVALIGNVIELKLQPSALATLMDGGALEVTSEQISKAQAIIPMDVFMPLYMVLLEQQRQAQAAPQTNQNASANAS